MPDGVYNPGDRSEQNKVHSTGRVVLVEFWINAVSHFSSPSA